MSAPPPSKLARPSGKVLVTGGCGFIGSHVVAELLTVGYEVVVVDNLDNSDIVAAERIKEVVGAEAAGRLVLCVPVDLFDLEATEAVFVKHAPFNCCVHFAALKAVGESVKLPLQYYHNNLGSTLNLVYLLQKYNCRNFVFSSSGAVYGESHATAIKEDALCVPINPYGKTKLMAEMILSDVATSEPGKWNILGLRYFNPIGAHKSGRLGESPNGLPNNLLPIICQIAVGKRPELSVFGNDWNTSDGTCVRDYIHISDLAEAHVCAVERTLNFDKEKFGWDAVNLGTGNGVTVLEMITAFEEANGLKIPYKFVKRRDGDAPKLYADTTKAEKVLGWKAKRSVKEGCEDAWRFITQNPNGYQTGPSTSAAIPLEQRGALVFHKFPTL